MSHIKNAPKFKMFDAGSYKVGIVVAKFNSFYTEAMLEEAKKVLIDYNVLEKNIKVLSVAGSMEIPVALQALAGLPAGRQEKEFDCLVAIGVIIKGETAHFDYVAKAVTEGTLRVSLDYKIPIGFGIVTAFTERQAEERVESGRGAALAALHTAHEIKNL